MSEMSLQTGLYRKKPVVIQAAQWDGTPECAKGIVGWIKNGGGQAMYHDKEHCLDCERTRSRQVGRVFLSRWSAWL